MTSAPLLAPGDELLDHPDANGELVEGSLRHIARANRWFGGWWAVQRGLTRLVGEAERGSRLTLLDVGTGSGDIPRRAARWAKARGFALAPVAIDRHRTAARIAASHGVPTALACASALPFGPKSVDLVLASQVAHHLAPAAIVEFLTLADRVARIGVVIADLRRSPLALAGFWLGARLLSFDPATRADGLTSVRRGFSGRELEALLLQANIAGRVERTPGFRLVVTWRSGARK